jgi:hypothetical protein
MSLNVKFYAVFVFLSRTVGCPSPGVPCCTVDIDAIRDNAISF